MTPEPYSKQAREQAAKGIVDGKPLSEWLDVPYGKFAQVVRDKVDPFFGLDKASEAKSRTWSVKVYYSYAPEPETQYTSVTYDIEAVTPEDAKEKAEHLFGEDGDLELGDDHEIVDMDEPRLSDTQPKAED